MSSAPKQSPKPTGDTPTHAVQLLAEAPAPHRAGRPARLADPVAARTGAHVRTLAAGLVARGLRVTLSGTESVRTGAAIPGTAFADAETESASEDTTDSPRTPTLGAPVHPDTALHTPGVDVVHAHGLWAGALATRKFGRHRRVPLIVSWHTREDARDPLWRAVVPVLERRVARAASVVLAGTPRLLDLARHRGARDARLAPAPPWLAGPAQKPHERRSAFPDVLIPDIGFARIAGGADGSTAWEGEAATAGTAERSVADTVQQVLSVYDEVLRTVW